MELPEIDNDKKLLSELANGSGQAFEQLFLSHYDNVYSAAYAYLKDMDEAKDVTQQVFLMLWEKREKLNVESIKGYLFISAKNLILNKFRKKSTETKFQEYLKEKQQYTITDPENLQIAKQEEEIIQAVLKKMPARQRQAYFLSREKGLNYKEIAKVMNVSRSTIKIYLTRSLASIREVLELVTVRLCPFLLLWLLK